MRYLILMAALWLPTQSMAENYLCISESANGYSVDNGNYEKTSFRTGVKWLVSFEKQTITKFGDNAPMFRNCEIYETRLFCEHTWGKFLMSRDTMKFMHYAISWAYVFDKSKDTPNIELGTCAPI